MNFLDYVGGINTYPVPSATGTCVCNANGKLRAVRKERLLIQRHRARSQGHPDVCPQGADQSQRACRPMTSTFPLGLRHLCVVRTREPNSPAQSTQGGERRTRSQKVSWKRQGRRPQNSQSDSRPINFFCLFYRPQASFKGSLGLQLQHIGNKGRRGGMVTRAKFGVGSLA